MTHKSVMTTCTAPWHHPGGPRPPRHLRLHFLGILRELHRVHGGLLAAPTGGTPVGGPRRWRWYDLKRPENATHGFSVHQKTRETNILIPGMRQVSCIFSHIRMAVDCGQPLFCAQETIPQLINYSSFIPVHCFMRSLINVHYLLILLHHSISAINHLITIC